jgi:transposase-like protein
MTKERITIRYSESFKMQVVSRIENGELDCTGASHCYSVSYAVIKRWVLKYGTLKRIPKLIRVETPQDQNQLNQLKQENKRLRKALADAVLEKDLSEIQLQIFCEQTGIDYEVVKKKVEQRRLEELRKRGML